MNPIHLYLLHFPNINKFYDTCGVDKKEELVSRIPGGATLSNRFLLDCIWWTMVVIEPFLSLFLITVFLPFFIFKVLFKKRVANKSKNVALCYAGLARQRINAVPEVYQRIDYYLYPLFVDNSWVMEGKERHNILESLNVWDVLKAYIWSIGGIVAATIKTHGLYLYRNYLCYEYILTSYYLNELSPDSTLYFVNHVDRWAVLFNFAPQKSKVLLQHGIESSWADWPIKLTTVTKAYVFCESQKERMTNAVLGHEPIYEVMPATISLTDMTTALRKNIVIVACDNYIFYDQEEKIIKSAVRDDLRIYVKIHPGKNDYQKYLNLKKKANKNLEVINTSTFPRVDAVVSYKSTLGLEYEALNIPVFYYDELPLEEIIRRINSL